jgi:DNA polymerase/3'-5' exonuclease PolX
MNGPFQLEPAQAKALEIVETLRPHTECIEIAGSIRRGKPWVKDIDLVVIPKMKSKSALFGNVSELAKTDFYGALRDVLYSITGEGERMVRGIATPGFSRGIPLDVYIATAESWATLLLIRTGSAEHNIWMCSRARACGGKLHADGSGLEVPGEYDAVLQRTVNAKIIHARDEEEIFKAMGMPYAEPGQRECVNARPVWLRAV